MSNNSLKLGSENKELTVPSSKSSLALNEQAVQEVSSNDLSSGKLSKQVAQELYDSYNELSNMNILVLKLAQQIEQSNQEHINIENDQQKELNTLKYELKTLRRKYGILKNRIQEKSEKLSHFPRNFGKRERRKDNYITDLPKHNSQLEEDVERPEAKLQSTQKSYKRERVEVYYYKDRLEAAENLADEEVKNLNDCVRSVEDENLQLKERIDSVMEKDFVKSFMNGKFTKIL